MAEPVTFRDTYRINMNKLAKQPLGSNKCTLPITTKNKKRISAKKASQILFSEDHVELMRAKYNYLSKFLGPTEARTIYEYRDTKGTVIVRLYPTNRVEIVSPDWTHADNKSITTDIKQIIEQHNKFINAASDPQHKK